MAYAQPRAIGARLGWNEGFVYQHSLSDKTFIELNAGVIDLFNGTHVDFLHEWIWLTPDWTPKGEWNWFAGVGANVGWKWNDPHAINGTTYSGYYDVNGNWHRLNAIMVGAIANIGLEYNFWFPLSLAVDYRPTFGVLMGKNAGTRTLSDGSVSGIRWFQNGLYDFALSVRYKF